MNTPNWNEQVAVIVATGPSVLEVPLDLARGRARVIAIKSTYRLCPWADVLYGTDKGWWIANRGAPDFAGLRITASPTVTKLFPGIELVRVSPGAFRIDARLRGSHSGLVALNLAINFGARTIVLVGFDMTLKFGKRFVNGEAGVAQINSQRLKMWCTELDELQPLFRKHGIAIVNCSPESALRAYRKRRFEDVFDGGQSHNNSGADPAGHPGVH